jgi:hypothetical protein
MQLYNHLFVKRRFGRPGSVSLDLTLSYLAALTRGFSATDPTVESLAMRRRNSAMYASKTAGRVR